jgi:hypothetical protein
MAYLPSSLASSISNCLTLIVDLLAALTILFFHFKRLPYDLFFLVTKFGFFRISDLLEIGRGFLQSQNFLVSMIDILFGIGHDNLSLHLLAFLVIEHRTIIFKSENPSSSFFSIPLWILSNHINRSFRSFTAHI